MKITKQTAVSLFLVFLFAKLGLAADFYVNLSGNDANQGTRALPVASLAKAQSLARKFSGIETVTVHVADGVYYLPETLVFERADSGSDEFPVVYAAENEGRAVLSGGTKLSLAWQPYRDGIFKANTPAGLVIDQLFVDGHSQRMARYPNYDSSKTTHAYQGYAADAFSKERAATWANPDGGYIHAMHSARWGGYHYRITGKDANGKVTYEGGWQNNRQMGMHNEFRMVENIFEELDAPGEWFHDAKTNMLYYMPVPDLDLASATVEVVRLKHLIEFRGSTDAPVANVTLKGFTVRHAARTFMETKEQMLRSDWAIYRGGAFMLTGTEDIHIVDCEFDQVGGNAIFVNNYNRGTVVKGTHIHDTGASGVCFVGDPDAVRDPLFEYGQKNDLNKIDRTPGPKSQNFPSLGIVEDCLIHGIGRVERQPAGVQMEMSQEITVRDCSIYDCARAGINIGDGAWGGHLIERCDVFDTVLETHDHGSFNSWGRDRYWRSDQPASQTAVDADPNLPFLDAVKTTTIRNSRWRCDHGWDIDLDDGSSNYDIYNNLLLNTGLKLREGFRRHAWNNVIPFGGLHPHVWYDGSKDQVYANIFATAHRPARMSRPYLDGTMVDRNLFTTQDPSILKASERLGWDKNSVLGDPMYVDPANGDFRVKDGSPALKLGFKNFPMDQFGVKKASLKAIAETPVIKERDAGRNSDAVVKTVQPTKTKPVWLGATLHSIDGEEFSAFGTAKADGGVALTKVPKTSAAANAGLRENDLIQAVDGKPIATVEQLFSELSKTKSASIKLKVIRDQQARELTVERQAIVEIESSSSVNGFKRLPLPSATTSVVTTNLKTSNDPISTLTDGKLDQGYGPIFGNGVLDGAYKMDLGSSKSVAAVSSWSYNEGGMRGAQKMTVYGSDASSDPGWEIQKFTAIGTIDTGLATAEYTAASLRAPEGKTLGEFRWIVWAVSPVTETGGGENTAFQEFAVEVAQPSAQEPTQMSQSFKQDLEFLKQHTPIVLLVDGNAAVAVAPAYQGRVMTSTFDRNEGPSFGWINRKVIAKGLLSEADRKGKLEEHIYVFGGEERFWLGPEGGQFALFFKPGAKFEFADWTTPAVIDTEPFELVKQSSSSAEFNRDCELTNFSGTTFKMGIRRTIRLLDSATIAKTLQSESLADDLKVVAYESENKLTNRGDRAWTAETGLPSIWLLGMYNPSPKTTVVIPFKSGDESTLGKKVNDTYFGKVPADYLTVKDAVLFFKGDGTRRGKIGISAQRSKGIAGSYDAEAKVLNIVTYNVQDAPKGYVNSMWKHQKEPYKGDVINSYNDGSPAPGEPPLGPFYELETSSPAAALDPGETMRHVQQTLHIQGSEEQLDAIAKRMLGVRLSEIKPF